MNVANFPYLWREYRKSRILTRDRSGQSQWIGRGLGLGQREHWCNDSVCTQQVIVVDEHLKIRGDHECGNSDQKDRITKTQKEAHRAEPPFTITMKEITCFCRRCHFGKMKRE